MSNATENGVRKRVTTERIRKRKSGGEPITLVTAYDYPMARWADQAGIDIIMVSDAFASVGLGREDALGVTLDETIHHTRAVRAGAGLSLTVSTMPFLSYVRPREAVANAARLVKEGGAQAVEVEGDAGLATTVRSLHEAGVAVLAHVGLTKTITGRTGSYRGRARTSEDAKCIVEDALTLAQAGAFAVLIECVPDRVAGLITEKLDVPTIGIGAGPDCDGQGLVSQDLLGMFDKFCPSFVKRYAALGDLAIEAFGAFRDDVVEKCFPGTEHVTTLDDDVYASLAKAKLRARK